MLGSFGIPPVLHEDVEHDAFLVEAPVDKPDPETNAPEQDETEEAGCGLVVPGGNTPLLLEMTNEALDA